MRPFASLVFALHADEIQLSMTDEESGLELENARMTAVEEEEVGNPPVKKIEKRGAPPIPLWLDKL